MQTITFIRDAIFPAGSGSIDINSLNDENDLFPGRLKLACQGILTACIIALSIYCVDVVIVSIDAVRVGEHWRDMNNELRLR